jgi:cytochrome c peroxidase
MNALCAPRGRLIASWLATALAAPDADRFNVTKKEADKYFFRTTMLRNISKTVPYFHDGSAAKIEDAVRIIAYVQLGPSISTEDIADIAAFFELLAGEIPAHYASPAKMVASK